MSSSWLRAWFAQLFLVSNSYAIIMHTDVTGSTSQQNQMNEDADRARQRTSLCPKKKDNSASTAA
jgi:hypothetical protein